MKRIFLLFLTAFLLMGCSLQETRQAPPEDARRLNLGTLLPEEVYLPLVLEFESRTGLFVDVKQADLDTLLADEQLDGLFGFYSAALERQSDYFIPISRDLELAPGILPGDAWYPLSVNQVVLAYHARLVRSPLPQTLPELLDPIWAGQIAIAHPKDCGLSTTVLALLTQATPKKQVLLNGLSRNIGAVTATCDEAVDLVAQGRLCMAIVTDEVVLNRNAVSNLTYSPLEDGNLYITTGSAILKTAPHPDNAQAFLDFLLEPGVQKYARDQLHLGSVRRELAAFGSSARIADCRELPLNWDGPAWADLWRERS